MSSEISPEADIQAAGTLASPKKPRTRKQHPDQPYGMTVRTHSGKSEADRIAEENQVLDMSLTGMTDRQIAAELNVSHTTVQNRRAAALTRVVEPKAEELRKVVDNQLDRLMNKLNPGIDRGDTKAINSALAVLDRKAKLHGLDAPSKVDLTVETEADREIKSLLAQITSASADARKELTDGS